VAAVSALGVAAVLAVLCVVGLSLAAWKSRASARERHVVQATWNSRSGLEHYLHTGELAERSLDPHDATQRCKASRQANGNLVFEGSSGSVCRTLVLVGGDPSRLTEQQP